MQGQINVRQFMNSDMKRVKEIERASIKYVTPLDKLLRYYDVPREGFLIAEINDKVVGYIVGNMIISEEGRKEGHILDIAVDPAHRKQGVGKILIGHILEIFKKRGAEKVRLEVKLNNIEARRFYSKLGFVETQIARHYYRMGGHTEDAVFMVKHLF
ncbi:MAG: ribosomal protein S18-alanine N-acetyltransferase [archaeon]|nr:ribosomal protein S18-alanine N-acetyltransferase [archaeon]MCP8322256.1 ribosomal protein S18-alanine N-acetyltransferase [archaeon]